MTPYERMRLLSRIWHRFDNGGMSRERQLRIAHYFSDLEMPSTPEINCYVNGWYDSLQLVDNKKP